METIIIIIVILLAVYAGMIVLQVFLAKKDNKWLGLILPIVSFLLSFIYPMEFFSTGDTLGDIITLALTLLIGNIPTIVLLLIWAAYRKSRRKKEQLDKMNIQDLK